MRIVWGALAVASVVALPGTAGAQAQADQAPAQAPASLQPAHLPAFATVDAIAVRYFAPETGGPTRPRFITSRQVDFEARLLALEDESPSVQLRYVRIAIDAHIANDMLATLPLDPEPDVATLDHATEILHAALEQRAGGKPAFEQAATLDGLTSGEVDVLVRRQARAAIYLDRTSGPILSATEDQLREAYRTTSHPFRQRRFDDCRDELARWLVLERFRAGAQAYMQTARSRVTVVYPTSI